jgi:hypothetical protein
VWHVVTTAAIVNPIPTLRTILLLSKVLTAEKEEV